MKKQLLLFVLFCAGVAPVAHAGLFDFPREICEHCGDLKALTVGQRFLYNLNEDGPLILGLSAGGAFLGGFASWAVGKRGESSPSAAEVTKTALLSGIAGGAAPAVFSLGETAWKTDPAALKESALEFCSEPKNIFLGLSGLVFGVCCYNFLCNAQLRAEVRAEENAGFISYLKNNKENINLTKDQIIAKLPERWKNNAALVGDALKSEKMLIDQFINAPGNRDQFIKTIEQLFQTS